MQKLAEHSAGESKANMASGRIVLSKPLDELVSIRKILHS